MPGSRRRLRATLLVALTHALVMACARPVTGEPQDPKPADVVQTRTYRVSNRNFANPERGFYKQATPFWRGEDRFPLSAARLARFRRDGITLIRAYYVIDEFRTAPLSPAALDSIVADFDAVRRAGLKIIPRFAYNFPTNDTYRQATDARPARVRQHIDQLRPVLRRYADVIAFMEAGFIGAWGEWHNSSSGLLNADHSLNDLSSTLIEHLLSALPERRMVALRYPFHKQQLYGRESLSPGQAFQPTSQARVGAHNDCFASDPTDGGTYTAPPEYAQTIDALKAYLSDDNRFVPQDGETCGTDMGADVLKRPFAHCPNALADLALMRWSALHIAYKPEVIALWKREGCFMEIQRRLGYRFRLIDGALPTELAAGMPFRVHLTIANDGWAAPFNPRLVELILRHASSGRVYRLPVKTDPRWWEPGATHDLEIVQTSPTDLVLGEYELLLNLPDPERALYSRPEYSIRLANAGVWERSTGFNSLQVRVLVAR